MMRDDDVVCVLRVLLTYDVLFDFHDHLPCRIET